MGKVVAFIFVFIILILPAGAFAQAKASAAFDRNRVEAGDTFALRVLVSGVRVSPQRVSFATWLDQIPTENIRSRSAWSRSGQQWVQQFTLIALDSAMLQLPPLTVYLHLGDTARTNPLQLTVTAQRASLDLQDMDDIRDIRREPAQWYDHWPWMVGILLLFGIFYWIYRRNSRRAVPIPAAIPLAPPPPSPQEVALQKLAALEKEQLWQKGRLLEYYAALSLIVREYLEHQFQFPALESTTSEISNLLKNTHFPDANRPVLDFLLQQADLVKYAEIAPNKDFHEQALRNARQVVGK